MGKGAKHWLKYLNREGLVLLLRELALESDTLKEHLTDVEKALDNEILRASEIADATETATDDTGEPPVMIEEIYGWQPEIDAFGPDEAWNGQTTDPSKAVTAGPTEEHAG
ncbi:MAG: hypothetical protein LLF96_12850 [Eubacteriales bacterium]|nr:hypothetical protein [Eubacteriales bacterium]